MDACTPIVFTDYTSAGSDTEVSIYRHRSWQAMVNSQSGLEKACSFAANLSGPRDGRN